MTIYHDGGDNEGETKGETNNAIQPAQRREPTAGELALFQKMAKTKQKLKSNIMIGVLASSNVMIGYFVLLNQLWVRDAADD